MTNNTTIIQPEKSYGEVVMVGDQTNDTIQALMQELFKMNDRLSLTHGEVRALADVSQLGKIDLDARTLATKGFSIIGFDKLAIVGASSENQQLIDMMMGLSGKEIQAKFFENRTEAEAWLTK